MEITRLDHLGIVAGVIKDLKLIEAIDERLGKGEEQGNISHGEAIAGMIINGLGFSDRPLSLTPQFFESKALELLFRPGIVAGDFNRHKLGRSLDRLHAYDCSTLYVELASQCCVQEGIDTTFNSLDTTSLSVTGEYVEDIDAQTIRLTHGYSKDHRPDLKQLIHELLVSQDGGVPLMMKSWDGNASDSRIFKERSAMLIEHFKQSDMPSHLIADSKLYSEENAPNLNQLTFITRIPGSIKKEQEVIREAIASGSWEAMDEANRYQVVEVEHYALKQRWIIVYSDKARHLAQETLNKAVQKELKKIESACWHLSNSPFNCAKDAQKAVRELAQTFKYHQLQSKNVIEQSKHATRGRPKKDAKPDQVEYFIEVEVGQNTEVIAARLNEKSCYVLGTNIKASTLTAFEVIRAYKQQNTAIENTGFRFLKDPLFFTSSLFLKKPSRIMGLLTVMTLALLVYSIAQRRLRKALEQQHQTLPNQINKPIKTPTMRWVFQLMDGIHFVNMTINGVTQRIVNGLNDIKKKIIRLMGETTMRIYLMNEIGNSCNGG